MTSSSAADSDVPDADSELGPWGTPRAIAEVNTADSETDASMTEDGLLLMFSRNGGTTDFDIYIAARTSAAEPFASVAPVSELNSSIGEFAYITADGLGVYMTRTGQPDIYYAGRATRGSTFSTPVVEPGVSSPDFDSNTELSADGLVAVIAHGAGTTGDLYTKSRFTPSSPWGPAVLSDVSDPAAYDSAGSFDRHALTIFFHSERAGGRHIFTASRPDVSTAFSVPHRIPEIEDPLATTEGDPWVSPDLHTLVWNRAGELLMSTR